MPRLRQERHAASGADSVSMVAVRLLCDCGSAGFRLAGGPRLNLRIEWGFTKLPGLPVRSNLQHRWIQTHEESSARSPLPGCGLQTRPRSRIAPTLAVAAG